jgi:hypothetical protein
MYTSSVIDVNDDTVEFIAVISSPMNQITSSVNSHVTIKYHVFIHARFVHTKATSGHTLSIVNSNIQFSV